MLWVGKKIMIEQTEPRRLKEEEWREVRGSLIHLVGNQDTTEI